MSEHKPGEHRPIDHKPIDPALRRFLDEQAAQLPPSPPPTDEDRARAGRALILKALESRDSIPGLPNDVTARNVEIAPGLQARLYIPRQPEPLQPRPVLVYLHGGGWVVGSTETHDPFCRLISAAAQLSVVSVDYRLAPEHRFPAALDDTLAAVHWVAAQAQEWGGDPTRLILGGDSAGGNLAAVAANRLCAQPDSPALCALLLLYPVTDHPSAHHRSYEQNATGYGLEANAMHWFWQQYAPGVSSDNPDVSPLRLPALPPLPPTLIATAEYDVLRDEALAYVNKLQAAGVPVTHLHAADMNHNFPIHPGSVARFPQSVATLHEIAQFLKHCCAPVN